MSSLQKNIQHITTACLLGAALALPASAVEPEVELRCEFQPTRADANLAHDAREANARFLRAEIAAELDNRRRAARAELSQSPTASSAGSIPR